MSRPQISQIPQIGTMCISLWQPWATLCVIGAKHFETRHWPTSYRGKLLIHSAKKWNQDLMRLTLSEPFRSALGGNLIADVWESVIPRGRIIGVVDLVECYEIKDEKFMVSGPNPPKRGYLNGLANLPGNELAFGNFAPGRFAWEFRNPVLFENPIRYSGRQSFFRVPDAVIGYAKSAKSADGGAHA